MSTGTSTLVIRWINFLTMYLILLCFILVAILVFTVLAFIITNDGSGHSVAGLRCGYPAVNASYYDLSFHPISSDKDCKIYKNSKEIKCYNCDSCKAGVAQYMKTEWRVVAIFNVVLFVVLSIIYFVGCCVKQNAARSHSKV